MYTVYSKTGCSYCDKAKSEIVERGESYTELMLEKKEVEEKVGRKISSYPVITKGDKYIGGYQELKKEWIKEDLLREDLSEF
jgi:glutaredoxin